MAWGWEGASISNGPSRKGRVGNDAWSDVAIFPANVAISRSSGALWPLTVGTCRKARERMPRVPTGEEWGASSGMAWGWDGARAGRGGAIPILNHGDSGPPCFAKSFKSFAESFRRVIHFSFTKTKIRRTPQSGGDPIRRRRATWRRGALEAGRLGHRGPGPSVPPPPQAPRQARRDSGSRWDTLNRHSGGEMLTMMFQSFTLTFQPPKFTLALKRDERLHPFSEEMRSPLACRPEANRAGSG